MSLAAFCSQKRSQILERLRADLPPAEGEFDERTWTEAKDKARPQVGPTTYAPHAVTFEFLYPVPGKTALLFKVALPTPERIVFLPVPEWVIESIWQGEVDGSFHFESDARNLIEAFQTEMSPQDNLKWFGPREPRRRE